METFIIEKIRHKTRVAVAGTQQISFATDLVLHVIRFLGKEIDLLRNGEERLSKTNDFVLIEHSENSPLFLEIHPNIVLVTGISNEELYENFIKSITSGGILIFNEEDQNLSKLVENSENHIRKIPYKTPDFQNAANQVYLNSDLGAIPLHISEENLSTLEGVRHLFQHIGIQEEEFYEAAMNF